MNSFFEFILIIFCNFYYLNNKQLEFLLMHCACHKGLNKFKNINANLDKSIDHLSNKCFDSSLLLLSKKQFVEKENSNFIYKDLRQDKLELQYDFSKQKRFYLKLRKNLLTKQECRLKKAFKKKYLKVDFKEKNKFIRIFYKKINSQYNNNKSFKFFKKLNSLKKKICINFFLSGKQKSDHNFFFKKNKDLQCIIVLFFVKSFKRLVHINPYISKEQDIYNYLQFINQKNNGVTFRRRFYKNVTNNEQIIIFSSFFSVCILILFVYLFCKKKKKKYKKRKKEKKKRKKKRKRKNRVNLQIFLNLKPNYSISNK